MIQVWREKLPESYLLILGDGPAGPEVPLERALYRATLSGREAVWLDCSLLSSLSLEAAEVLMAYQQHLLGMGVALVLSHVSAAVQQQLRATVAYQEMPPIVASLLEASGYVSESAGEKAVLGQLGMAPSRPASQPSRRLSRISYRAVIASTP